MWPPTAHAQSAIPEIGYLGFGSPDGFATRLAAYRQGLHEAGYDEGQNVLIEYRWADGQNDRLPALAADLVHRHVAVIATPSSANAAQAAKLATATIPIVFETGVYPVATGLVTSLSRPSGNITGVTSLNVEVGRKRLAVLRELLPTATIVAALVNPTNASTETVTRDLQAAADALRLQLHILYASSERDFDSAFAMLRQVGASGLVVSPDPLFIGQGKRLVDLSLGQRIATLFFSRNFVTAGGLISYGGSVSESHRQAGIYTGRILKGEKPADLPVQQITKFELAINLKTAKAFGVTAPQTLLVEADEVIE